MHLIKAALTYFALVFGTGFVLGTFRVLLLVPRLGVRTAELLEMPLMLITIVLAARLINQWFVDVPLAQKLWVGLIALIFLLLAEVAIGVGLQGKTVFEALLDKDPVSGSIYYLSLVIFALMPWLLTVRQAS